MQHATTLKKSLLLLATHVIAFEFYAGIFTVRDNFKQFRFQQLNGLPLLGRQGKRIKNTGFRIKCGMTSSNQWGQTPLIPKNDTGICSLAILWR